MLLSLFAKSTGQQNINSNSKLIEIEQFVCLKVEKYEKKLTNVLWCHWRRYLVRLSAKQKQTTTSSTASRGLKKCRYLLAGLLSIVPCEQGIYYKCEEQQENSHAQLKACVGSHFKIVYYRTYMQGMSYILLDSLCKRNFTRLVRSRLLNKKLISRWDRRTLPPEPHHRCKTLLSWLLIIASYKYS